MVRDATRIDVDDLKLHIYHVDMVERFSVSIDSDLIRQFDRWLHERRYNNRSEAVRDLIRRALIQQRVEDNREVVAVITIVYDHHQRQLQERLTDIQHAFHHEIVSTTHIHLNHDDCLEVIIARGRATKAQDLADRLISLRGVKDGSITMSAAGSHLHGRAAS